MTPLMKHLSQVYEQLSYNTAEMSQCHGDDPEMHSKAKNGDFFSPRETCCKLRVIY